MCRAAAQRRASDCAHALADLDQVLGTDLLDPESGPRAGWTIEATCTGAAARPSIYRVLRRYHAELLDATARGEPARMVVTVTL